MYFHPYVLGVVAKIFSEQIHSAHIFRLVAHTQFKGKTVSRLQFQVLYRQTAYLLPVQLHTILVNVQNLEFSILGIGIRPPRGIVDAFYTAVVALDAELCQIMTIEFQIDVGRPVIVVAGCFGTNLKADADGFYILPPAAVCWKYDNGDIPVKTRLAEPPHVPAPKSNRGYPLYPHAGCCLQSRRVVQYLPHSNSRWEYSARQAVYFPRSQPKQKVKFYFVYTDPTYFLSAVHPWLGNNGDKACLLQNFRMHAD